ncbi:hypothetical protein ACIBHX_17110 [Nonomuraea sp. NPDC050536]|uniref:hypothetical protein n=1 Tax=Nonomuraea sp. NPDC050536 TaxID=3364366 RepID=UPI0037C81EB2
MRLTRLAALVASLLVAALLSAAPAHSTATRPLALTITKVKCIDDCRNDGLESDGESAADFFTLVWIDGVQQPRPPRAPDDQEEVTPFWVIPANVDSTHTQVPITIQIWDWDTTSGHDLGDASPNNGDNNLDLTVSMDTGRWTGDVNWPQACSIGDGGDDDEPRVEVCFDISTDTTTGDADGDGLLDGWERNGYNDNADSVIDVDLPKMGAKPDHKDLFVELDYVGDHFPSKEDVEAVRAAYAAAPVDAGGVRNPDGKRGITFHLDMGARADSDLREGQAKGTCGDGIDNGGDGDIDGADADCTFLDGSVEDPQPGNCLDNVDNDGDSKTDAQDDDCLIGDDFHDLWKGSELLGVAPFCGFDGNAFYNTKRTAFDPARRFIFHYGISLAGSAKCGKGGQGEIGGNDIVDHNGTGRTLFHELGHNLGLRHGGFENNPCKPNYVSLMNYTYKPGIPQQQGGAILDYSPPRTALDGSNRDTAPLAPLVENMLNENVIVDPSDKVNRFNFTDKKGNLAPHNLNGNPDWDGDGADPPYENPVTANVDNADPSGNPKKCVNTSTTSTLKGYDDWSHISLPFHESADSADAPVNPETEPELTEEEIQQLWQTLNTADLSVALSDSPDPVGAGTDLTYTVTVRNDGPAPATSVLAKVTLPAEVAYVGSTATCNATGCHLGEIPAHGQRSFTVTAHVPEDLVYRNGGPKTINAVAEVSNQAGPDPDSSNNRAQESTKVVAMADLAVTGLTATAPDQILIGQTQQIPLHVTAANKGPSTPMNATVKLSASAESGASITPSTGELAVPALAVGSPRELDSDFTVGCTRPGHHTYKLTASIEPASAEDIDPEPGNNTRTVEFTLDCVVPVAINIKPGSNPNSINPPNALVPLAVLTTTAGEYGLPLAFDAATVQPLTVRFSPRGTAWAGNGASEVHQRGHLEDSLERGERETVRDGDTDMVLHFNSGDADLQPAMTEACVKGSFTGEGGQVYRFFGCDAVRVL